MKISPLVASLAAAAAVLSYVGSVCWLYEAKRAGVAMLWLVAACCARRRMHRRGTGTVADRRRWSPRDSCSG